MTSDRIWRQTQKTKAGKRKRVKLGMTLKSFWGKFLARRRAISSAVSWPLIRETRTTHHWGPKWARVSRLSSSVQDLYLFLGFLRSLSSTCSLQLVPALLSLLSFLRRLLSRALSSSWLVLVVDSRVAETDSGESLIPWVENGGGVRRKRRCWQGLHSRSPCVIPFLVLCSSVSGSWCSIR